MTPTQYIKNLQLMTNPEIMREHESVQSLVNVTTSQQSNWRSKLEKVSTEMIGRGLKPIN